MHSICVHSRLLSNHCENSDKVCDVLESQSEATCTDGKATVVAEKRFTAVGRVQPRAVSLLSCLVLAYL